VLVVPASNARGIARQFRAYRCQNRRSFKPSRWIAFYANGQIDTYAEIIQPPEDDVIFSRRPDLINLATAMDGDTPYRLLRLDNVSEIGPIINDAKDKSGRPVAWVQNQRYTTIDRIRSAKKTSDL